MSFAEMGLRPELLQAIADQGYTIPTPVQAAAIPVVLTGEDVLAGAQTGTGKTAGFVLPMLQRLMASQSNSRAAQASARPTNPRWAQPPAPRRPVRCLILTPTRELAAQVEESVRTYGKHLPLNSTTVFGGVGMMPQVHKLRAGVDILVATPGRLLDHLGQRTLDLSQVEIFVLDEADRMLDMGFIRDIRRILPLLPEKRQNLLFSATFSDEIKTLANDMLNKPRHIEVARPNEESALVTQAVYLAPRELKRDLLTSLLTEQKMTQVLVFTRTKHGADRLASQLEHDGIVAAPIHGNRSQSQRTKALADFKNGLVRVLVATDIAARGLDIPQMPHVINYELPNVPEDYVHRIGRTGRAGHPGEALSLVGPDERAFLHDIEKLMGKRLERRAHALVGGEVSEEAPLGEQIQPFKRAQFERQPQGPRASNFGGGYGQGRGPSRPRPAGRPGPQVEFPRSGSDTRPARSAASSTPRHRRPASTRGE